MQGVWWCRLVWEVVKMADVQDKKYYWIKLRDSFMTSDKVDFLMSQPNGSKYIVLYQMLCLKTINTGGELSRSIGEIIIPFDEDKIQRDCKYFDIDTIRIALSLYKKLGMIYEQDNGLLIIADFENMVGSETYWAEKKREQRKKLDIVQKESNKMSNDVQVRDKRLDIRDIDNKSNKNINNNILSVSKTETNDIIPFSDESVLIFNLWNTFDIIQHRTLTADIEKAINKAVALYSVDKVCEGIRNYATIFNDKNYFFNYKWKLIDFIKQANALPTFFNEGDKWQNYLNSKGGKKAQENEILNQVQFSEGWFN